MIKEKPIYYSCRCKDKKQQVEIRRMLKQLASDGDQTIAEALLMILRH
jgi:hypothetical protein